MGNPVVIKELRSLMRGGRAFMVLTIFLLILSLVTFGLFRIVTSASQFDANGLVSAVIGQSLFAGLAFIELLLILFITPALTAGTISSEQENLTYDMLLATPLKPATILWGKLLSSMSYVMLLIFAGIPLASLIFIFGGVAPIDTLKALLVLIMTSLTFGLIGLFFSALTGRTATATVLTYTVLLLLSIGTLFIYIVWGVMIEDFPPRAVLVLNPFSGMASVLASAVPSGGRLGLGIPFGALAGEFQDFSDIAPAIVLRPTWHFTLTLYVGLSLTLYIISTQLIKPVKRWQFGRGGTIAIAACIAVFGILSFALLRPSNNLDESGLFPTSTPNNSRPERPRGLQPAPIAPVPTELPPSENSNNP